MKPNKIVPCYRSGLFLVVLIGLWNLAHVDSAPLTVPGVSAPAMKNRGLGDIALEPTPTSTPAPTPAPGECVVTFSQNFDGVVMPALPAGWASSNPIPGDGVEWVTTT